MSRTIKSILDMSWNDLSKLSTKELRKISTQLNSAANKRLRRLESSNAQEWSPAYQYTRRARGDFSTKGLKTRTDLKNEIQRASSFMTAKTSTLKGAKQYKETAAQMFTPEGEDKISIEDLTKKQKNTIFRALDRLREENAALVYNIGSDIIIKELRKAQMEKKSRNRYQLLKAVKEKLPDLMESSEERYEREEAERQARTDEDGVFHSLTSEESEENPFR